jgi:hypothetical protein
MWNLVILPGPLKSDLRTGVTRPGTDFIGQIAVKSWPGEHNSNLPVIRIALRCFSELALPIKS